MPKARARLGAHRVRAWTAALQRDLHLVDEHVAVHREPRLNATGLVQRDPLRIGLARAEDPDGFLPHVLGHRARFRTARAGPPRRIAHGLQPGVNRELHAERVLPGTGGIEPDHQALAQNLGGYHTILGDEAEVEGVRVVQQADREPLALDRAGQAAPVLVVAVDANRLRAPRAGEVEDIGWTCAGQGRERERKSDQQEQEPPRPTTSRMTGAKHTPSNRPRRWQSPRGGNP